MQDLFRAFPALMSEFDRNAEMREALVFAAWRRVAGQLLEEQTAPLELDDLRLKVAVRSASWQRHLEDLSGQMIFKLNSVLGSAVVTFIEFTVDESAVENARAANERAATGLMLDETAVRSMAAPLNEKAAAISDDALREAFLLAAGSCLERKRLLKD